MKYIVLKGKDKKHLIDTTITTKCTPKHIKRAYKKFAFKPTAYAFTTDKKPNYALLDMFATI